MREAESMLGMCRRRIMAWTVAAVLLPWLSACRSHPHVQLTVSVAASLTGTIEEVEAAYARRHPEVEFRNNFGSSGALARQIEQGAPVDLLISAGTKPVQDLAAKGLLASGQSRVLLRNRLVLIVPPGSKIASLRDLQQNSVAHIAMGDPQSVPAGLYALQTLQTLHLDRRLQPRLVLAKDVRQVMAYVQSGNADAGFVYATDAASSLSVQVAAVVDDAAHEPIEYPVAIMAASSHPRQAQEFLDALFATDAAALFAAHGFAPASGR